jgi:bile acid:Na+ symporter, BASS family
MLIRPLPLLNFFVIVVTFAIGLRVRGGELLDIARDRALLMRALLANCILIPVIGFFLVHLFPLTPDVRVGILLLAAIPGTPIALQFIRSTETHLAFAGAMTFALSVASIVMTPLIVEVVPETGLRSDRPVLLLIVNIALYIALPLAAGLGVSRLAPKIAHLLVLPLGILASIMFPFLMWETRTLRAEAVRTVRGSGSILAMLLLLFLSMWIGWRIGGPGRESRRVLAISTSMRSVIVVLYVARYCFPGTGVYMVPIVYLSLMVPANLILSLAVKGWTKLRPAEKT